MENSAENLLESLKQYETQLSQIKQAIKSSKSSDSVQDLRALEKDIEELISLTKETLNNSKQSSCEDATSTSNNDSFSQEYALFKAELADLEGNSSNESENHQNVEVLDEIPQELQDDLNALKGSKCQAPHKQQWGDESYHNALIIDLETKPNIDNINHIQVRVMFVNPTEKDMLPCPYYLDGDCRFSDDKCHFSHGELVPLSDIREYREPDFSLVKEGSRVLAKQKDSIWYRAKIKDILGDNKCLAQFESKGCETVVLDLQDILPLDGEQKEDWSSSESDNDSSAPQEYFVQLSLLRTPPNKALGAWEKHTKGIGSRLMANMGYVIGCGLGKYGEGRMEPVEAMAYPPGKSLDACMALREAAGGDKNMFKAEQRQRKQQRQLQRIQQRQQARTNERKDVFSFINSKLSGSVEKSETLPKTSLATSSRKRLNVERFQLGENIKKKEKVVKELKSSLKRHAKGSSTHNIIKCKLETAEQELNNLENTDKLIAEEQVQREGQKKMTLF